MNDKCLKKNCVIKNPSSTHSLCCYCNICIETSQQIFNFSRFSRGKQQKPIQPTMTFNGQIRDSRTIKHKFVNHIRARFEGKTPNGRFGHFSQFIAKEQISLQIDTNITYSVVRKGSTLPTFGRTTMTINLKLFSCNNYDENLFD